MLVTYRHGESTHSLIALEPWLIRVVVHYALINTSLKGEGEHNCCDGMCRVMLSVLRYPPQQCMIIPSVSWKSEKAIKSKTLSTRINQSVAPCRTTPLYTTLHSPLLLKYVTWEFTTKQNTPQWNTKQYNSSTTQHASTLSVCSPFTQHTSGRQAGKHSRHSE